MSKYTPLSNKLNELKGEIWNTNFEELERIIKTQLPNSARIHREWWANHKKNTQAKNWMRVGWMIQSINLKNETLSFVKSVILSE